MNIIGKIQGFLAQSIEWRLRSARLRLEITGVRGH